VYTLISLLILTCSFFLFKKVSGSLKLTQLNMISWVFYYNLLAQSFVASILVVNNIDNHYLVSKISNESSRYFGWLAVQYTMLMMPLGMLFILFLFGYKTNSNLFQSYVRSPILPLFSLKDSYMRIPLYVFSAISVLSVLYVFYYLRTIPLFSMLGGAGHEILNGLRQEASREFGGNTYVKNIFALALTPILSYVAFAYFKMTGSKKDLIWFLVLFFSSFMILTYNIAKAPFIQYLLGFVFLNVLINGNIKKKTLGIAFALVLALLIVMYFLIAKVTDPSVLFSYNSGIMGRIFLSQAAGIFMTFDAFPDFIPHIGFASVSQAISDALGVSSLERSGRLLMEFFNPNAFKAGVAGVYNSLFIAEAWANFGLIGVVIAPFYVGAIIQLLFMLFLKLPKSPIVLGLFTSFSYKSAVTGGVNEYFYSAGYLVLLVAFLGVFMIGKGLRKYKKNLEVNK
jgi:oligosaccharide repeat unit polymerase